jgi:uncharacterized integral membrane protein
MHSTAILAGAIVLAFATGLFFGYLLGAWQADKYRDQVEKERAEREKRPGRRYRGEDNG